VICCRKDCGQEAVWLDLRRKTRGYCVMHLRKGSLVARATPEPGQMTLDSKESLGGA